MKTFLGILIIALGITTTAVAFTPAKPASQGYKTTAAAQGTHCTTPFARSQAQCAKPTRHAAFR